MGIFSRVHPESPVFKDAPLADSDALVNNFTQSKRDGDNAKAAALARVGSGGTGPMGRSTTLLQSKLDKSTAEIAEQKERLTQKAVAMYGRLSKVFFRYYTTLWKLSVFGGLNAILVVCLFVLPKLQQYKYYTGSLGSGVDAVYELDWGTKSGNVALFVDDVYEAAVSDVTVERGAAYSSLVSLPTDAATDPGWNLADILGITRVVDPSLVYYDPTTGARMVQDYRVCQSGCLNATGYPTDMANSITGLPTRNFTQYPYGQPGDYYLNRAVFLRQLDPDFYDAFINSTSALQAVHYGGFGQSGADQGNYLNQSDITGSGYLCQLGIQRRPFTGITIQTMSCHVEIASTTGDGWSMFIRADYSANVVANVTQNMVTDSSTGCNYYNLIVSVQGPGCPEPQLPGTATGTCDGTCAVVLFKGTDARQMPISVVETAVTGASQSTLRISDQYLNLQHRIPNDSLADLNVTGSKIGVQLSNAHISRVSVANSAGDISLDYVRVDRANLSSTEGDIILQDNRDTVLRYRSASNFLCAAAPLVEAMPADFIACDMNPPDSATNAAAAYQTSFTDTTITQAQFASGMAKLGLDYSATSLDLTAVQQAALIAHVFSAPDSSQLAQGLSFANVNARLRAAIPSLLTLYDSGSRDTYDSACVAAGGSDGTCINNCTYVCNGQAIGVNELGFGRCDVLNGCKPTCGTPDRPITRDTSSAQMLDFSGFDVNGDQLIDSDELRMGMLWTFSNCTYYIVRPDGYTCYVVDAPTMWSPGSGDDKVIVKCTQEFLENADDWRVNNIKMNGTASSILWGTSVTECRPFPDYDNMLNGRQYNESVTPTDCPACFLSDGSLAPEKYFNRSIWDPANSAAAMAQLYQILSNSSSVDLGYFPYFNISDDSSWNTFSQAILSPGAIQTEVPLWVFNMNLQSLPAAGILPQGFRMLNPECSNGVLLKTRPTYVANDPSQAAKTAAAMILWTTDGSSMVNDTRMPLFAQSTVPNDTAINSCPLNTGNGTQGSTTFSYFVWANTTTGYKWGTALPEYCMDERWPDGGIWNGTTGVYPNDPRVYGPLAGLPIAPGCVPVNCTPNYLASAQQGTIHAQVLPFPFDPLNITGNYQTMVDNCQDPAASTASSCFFKGYPDSKDALLHAADVADWQALMDPCMAGDVTCSDTLQVLHVSGQGAPDQEVMYWSSRYVYMQLEPAWFYFLSATLLGPEVVHTNLRLAPGFCSATTGAVEAIDWRDQAYYGASTGSNTGLRATREAAVYQALNNVLNGTDPVQSGWFLKQMWRKLFVNESLYYSPTTGDAILDTSPGVKDASGKLHGVGLQWRHHRVCYDSSDCSTNYFTYRDNCYVDRSPMQLANGTWALSPCIFPNGSRAYADRNLGEAGVTFNETFYTGQFPAPLASYSAEAIAALGGDGILNLDDLVTMGSHAADNVTTFFSDKWEITVSGTGAVTFTNAQNAWMNNSPLIAAIMLSITIAVLSGLLVMGLIVFGGLSYLKRVNANIQTQEKCKEARTDERKEALFKEILDCKRYRVREARIAAAAVKAAQQAKQEAAGLPVIAELAAGSDGHVIVQRPKPAAALFAAAGAAADSGAILKKGDAVESAAAVAAESSTNAAAAEPAPDPGNVDDVTLTKDEKAEILAVMEEEGEYAPTGGAWDITDMKKIWLAEVLKRGVSADNCTLSMENRLKPTTDLLFKGAAHLGANMGKAGLTGVQNVGKVGLAGFVKAVSVAKKLAKIEKARSGVVAKDVVVSSGSRRGTGSRRSTGEPDGHETGASSSPSSGHSNLKESKALSRKKTQLDTTQQAKQVAKKIGRSLPMRLISRAIKAVVAVFLLNFPSPFQVIDQVTAAARNKLIDSLKTFFKVKCVTDRPLERDDDIRLGQMPGDVASRIDNNSRGAGGDGGDGGAGGKEGKTREVVEFEGIGDVVAVRDRAGLQELYRVQYVRVTLEVERVQKHTEDDGDEHILTQKREAWKLIIEEGPGRVTSGAYRPANEPCLVQPLPLLAAAAAPSALRFSEAGAAPNAENSGSSAGADAPAVVTLPARKFVICQNQWDSESNDWREVLDGRVRHYVIESKTGPSVITFNAGPGEDDVDINGDLVEGVPELQPRPTMQFATNLRTFRPEYEDFCHEQELEFMDTLENEKLLESMNIAIKKRVSTRVSGMRVNRHQLPQDKNSWIRKTVDEFVEDDEIKNRRTLSRENSKNLSKSDSTTGEKATRKRVGLATTAAAMVALSRAGASARQEPRSPVHVFVKSDDEVRGNATLPDEAGGDGDKDDGSKARGGEHKESAHKHSLWPHLHLAAASGHKEAAEEDSPDEALSEAGSSEQDDDNERAPLCVQPSGQRGALYQDDSDAEDDDGTGANAAGAAPPAGGSGKVAIKPACVQQIEASTDPVAVFLRENFRVTGNFSSDSVDLEIIQRAYKRWLKQQARQAQYISRQIAVLADIDEDREMNEGDVPPPPQPPDAAPSAPLVLQQSNFEQFGLKVAEKPDYQLLGTMVNQADFEDNPQDANHLLYLATEVVAVIMHTLFVWLVPMPLFLAVFAFQSYYDNSTAISPQTTFSVIRLDPLAFIDAPFPLLLQAVMWALVAWILLSYVMLVAHYIMDRDEKEDSATETIVKTVFWMLWVLLVSILVAYIFEIFCWVILGAVINPNRFMPYSVACVTLVAHAQATYGRLAQKYEVVYQKLTQSMQQQMFGKVSAAVAECKAVAESKFQANVGNAVAAAGGGNSGGGGGGGSGTSTPNTGGGAGGSGAPGFRSALSGLQNMLSSHPGLVAAGAGAGGVAAGAAAVGLSRGGGNAAGSAGGSAAGSQRQTQSRRTTAASRRVTGEASAGNVGGQTAGDDSGQPATAAPAAAAAAKGDDQGPGKPKKMEPYAMFRMFADKDDNLDYQGFCALLEQCEINMIDAQRQKLFARVDRSGNRLIDYTEFQQAFHLLQEQAVDKRMKQKGLTRLRLLMAVAYAVVILLLIFVFIFLGVAAFSGGGTVSSVVNSLMAAGSGFAMNFKKAAKADLDGDSDSDDEEGGSKS